ncbi:MULTISPECIES: ferritin [Methanothermobacter]|jgi:ferritin|uniref:Ferritin like protein (RsgA) n=3 Tax=Methanothermobacter TaxID=145260 RepID=O26261_METTH|nr:MULTISPECIES: ferritin [Methanothermobacter]MDK2874776.1 ferritin [Methanothermobacter sp.]AAB84664.1 ferritin like protein (RsgA) [Methanothermobacter thermautotrophicus str. Delta H]MDN5373808.1 ferritin [Methanothermobacter sp.]NLU03698.1 ferritin [Methanothermobacter sp.]REE25306.1 ferritin [Methanothermobacter defluvii]
MVSERMQEALNRQLNAELYSAYLYLSMAAYYEASDLPGFANWMRVQAQEELSHAMKFYDYLVQRGARVVLDEIEKPPFEWESPLEVAKHVLEHEKKVTGLINDLVDLAISERDHATNNFLQWFVAEQVEEEESAGSLLQRVRLASDSPSGLLMLDAELAKRVYNPPADKGE